MNLPRATQPPRRRTRRRVHVAIFVLLCALVSTRFANDAEEASANSAVSDDAHPAVDVASLDNIPVETWGVSGQDPASTQTPSLEVLVWDIQQAGGRIFVAGGFLNVQENKDATPIPQPYLAAFDVNTGEWISTCTPQLDRIAYSLTVNSRGALLVGGEFTQVNGQPREGLVALDPATCDIDSAFEGSLERPWSSKRAMARELEVVDGTLYVVGNFSHARGPAGQRERVYKAVRMDAETGAIDAGWKPEVSGSSIWGLGVDQARGRVHFTGYFTSVNGEAGSGYFHTVDTATGASVTGLTPLPHNQPRSQPEMFDVAMGIDRVFVAGEQHIVQVLDADTHDMLGFVTTGYLGCAGEGYDHFAWCNAFAGGAYQVAERVGDVMFVGCHCTYAVRYGNPGFYDSFSDTRRELKVVMALDAATGTVIDTFDPDATVAKDGAWAVASDSNGCLYVGGDYDNRGVDAQLGSWAGGFIKMCPVGWTPPDPGPDPDPLPDPDPADVEPPTVPGSPAATDLGGGTVQITWTASTDNTGIQSYLVYRNGAYIAWTPDGTLTHDDTGLTDGVTYSYELRAVDLAGNRSAKTTPITITVGP